MSPPFQEETYSVSALCEEVRDLLQQAYTEVWVVGEVNRVRDHRSGHFYFELIEKGADDQITAKLEAVAWRHDYRRIRQVLDDSDQKITEGQEIRCRGRLDFYPPFGRLQFVVREVDPVFSLGLMARRRQETLAALAKAGLLDRNRSLRLAELPLRVGWSLRTRAPRITIFSALCERADMASRCCSSTPPYRAGTQKRRSCRL